MFGICSLSLLHILNSHINMAELDLLFLLHLLLIYSVSGDSADQYLYGGCSTVKYSADTSYGSNLDNLLTSIANSATFQPYNNFTMSSSTREESIYGLYQCRGDISMPDCAICVQQAVSQFHDLCHEQNCGGVIQLEGCFVKYDNASFIGQLDKAVVLRKCGPSPDGYDSELKSRRDGVLEGLLNSGQPYRVSGSENVQSVGQCVGDLSQSQCQECVIEAIRMLKQECFMNTYGDMFLGKCYVRYTINRAHAPSTSNGHSSMFSSSEKTFAIIAGLLAAMLLLIIFLIFLKKTFVGQNGK